MGARCLSCRLCQGKLLLPLFVRLSVRCILDMRRRPISELMSIELVRATCETGGGRVVLMAWEVVVTVPYMVLLRTMLTVVPMVLIRLGPTTNLHTITLMPMTAIHVNALSLLVALIVHVELVGNRRTLPRRACRRRSLVWEYPGVGHWRSVPLMYLPLR